MDEINDKETLEAAILKELLNTGYPTEIISSSMLQRLDWSVTHNPSYLDDLEGRSREYDILASKYWEVSEEKIQHLSTNLLIECKKSDKPWVFFTTPEIDHHPSAGRLLKGHSAGFKLFTNLSNVKGYIDDGFLLSNHHYFSTNTLARTFHQPLKKDKEGSSLSNMIYSAVMSCVKATLFQLRERSYLNVVQIFYPLIIFNGDLYEAQVESNEKIKLKKSSHLQLSFHYFMPENSTNPYNRNKRPISDFHHEFQIDVIHIDFIEDYLKIVESDTNAIVEYIQDKINKNANA